MFIELYRAILIYEIRWNVTMPNFIYLYISLKNAVFTRLFVLWRFGGYAIYALTCIKLYQHTLLS